MTTVNPASPGTVDSYAVNNTSSMSVDALLILFSQASDANQVAEKGMKDRIEASIGAKTSIGAIQRKLQALSFDHGEDNKIASAGEVKQALTDAIANCKDPDAKKAMQDLYNRYFGGAAGTGNGDNDLSDSEAKEIGTSLDSISAAVDDNMQILTLNLKQAEEKFSQITDIIKQIMDSKNKVTDKINSNQ